MKFSVAIKKLKNPRVRKRLKIALSVYAIGIMLAIGSKVVYDIGYFNALALDKEKKAKRYSPAAKVVLTTEYAQRIVSGALKEDPANPQTIVERISSNNRDVAAIVIKSGSVKQVGWIVDMRLFFVGDIFDGTGYNLTKAIERKHGINDAGY